MLSKNCGCDQSPLNPVYGTESVGLVSDLNITYPCANWFFSIPFVDIVAVYSTSFPAGTVTSVKDFSSATDECSVYLPSFTSSFNEMYFGVNVMSFLE